MDQERVKELCLGLLRADTEDEVVKLLKDAGYWDRVDVWRQYGDTEGNWATIGNQQSRPEAALVEKIINSVDARLMNACLERGIDPESADAPPDIPSAVSRFFPGTGGSLREWQRKTRTEEAKNITLAATGAKRHPCLTIVDRGEGQTPKRVPETFMSIHRQNKLCIPFVQGKFNMGGTGVLKFCGSHRFQLVVTRRNPAILSPREIEEPTSSRWSFTITRRERPKTGVGAARNSVFTYLAPIGADENRRGDVLSFDAESLPLMPRIQDPYAEEVEFGSAVKLYEYDVKGFSSHICMPDGLLGRLDVLLPEIALPVNLHECRDYRGHKGSFVTPLAGLVTRLEAGKGGNVEPGFPDSVPFEVRGEKMVAKIYLFNEGKADKYRTNEGVIFAINGQTHGALPVSIFSRNKVKLGRLASSLLVTVDCTGISNDAIEDLFMNSRDRLSHNQLRKEIEAEIEEILSTHEALKRIANERKQDEVKNRLADSKPLEEVLGSIFRTSPALNALFRTGSRLANPYNPGRKTDGGGGQGGGRGSGNGGGPGGEPFVGKRYPTYFRFFKMKDAVALARNCEHGRRCRITFETDAENEYFKRGIEPGWYDVDIVEYSGGDPADLEVSHNLILHDGLAHWSIQLPDEVDPGESVTLQCTVADPVNTQGFVNIAKLTVHRKSSRPNGAAGVRRRGSTGGGNGSAGIKMPDAVRVKQPEWEKHGFDEHSACKVVQEADGAYTHFINVDNLYLQHEIKHSRSDPALLEAKFLYANVLVSLALIHDHSEQVNGNGDGNGNGEGNGDTVADRVFATTKALGPFLVPMIDHLGALSDDDLESAAHTGDDE